MTLVAMSLSVELPVIGINRRTNEPGSGERDIVEVRGLTLDVSLSKPAIFKA